MEGRVTAASGTTTVGECCVASSAGFGLSAAPVTVAAVAVERALAVAGLLLPLLCAVPGRLACVVLAADADGAACAACAALIAIATQVNQCRCEIQIMPDSGRCSRPSEHTMAAALGR